MKLTNPDFVTIRFLIYKGIAFLVSAHFALKWIRSDDTGEAGFTLVSGAVLAGIFYAERFGAKKPEDKPNTQAITAKDQALAKKSLSYLDANGLKNFSEHFDNQFTMVEQNRLRPIEVFRHEFSQAGHTFDNKDLNTALSHLLRCIDDFLQSIALNMGVPKVSRDFFQINTKLDRSTWIEDYDKKCAIEMNNILVPKKNMVVAWSQYFGLLSEKFPDLYFHRTTN